MRILVLGAGAIGGYFGARLLQAGIDVTFLVRGGRATQLRQGLSLRSPQGDLQLPAPAIVTAEDLRPGYQLILLSCKAYDLDAAITAIAPAVDDHSAIVPLLNGMQHMDRLRARFGAHTVMGGTCLISATLDTSGTIVHFNDLAQLTFGEWDGTSSQRSQSIAQLFAKARGMNAQLSQTIEQDMWEKWVMIATSAAATCLMRAAIGDIVRADGVDFVSALLGECVAIAAAHDHAVRAATQARVRGLLGASDSMMMASMLRDVERGGRIESDAIIGGLLSAAREAAVPAPTLRLAYLHLKSYEQRRQREAR